MDVCPKTIPKDSASAGRPNEVRYDLHSGKSDILKSDILDFQGIEPGVRTAFHKYKEKLSLTAMILVVELWETVYFCLQTWNDSGSFGLLLAMY